MSMVATWLCIALLSVIIAIVACLMVSLKFMYPPTLMMRNVKCLADIVLMVEESSNFLEKIARNGPDISKQSSLQTRLGWFRTRTGVVKWGIEVVDHSNGVEWVARLGTST